MKKPKRNIYQVRVKENSLRCSFCGGDAEEVEHLIQADTQPTPCTVTIKHGKGYPPSVFQATAIFNPHICDECVAFCVEVLAENKKGGAAAIDPANHKE